MKLSVAGLACLSVSLLALTADASPVGGTKLIDDTLAAGKNASYTLRLAKAQETVILVAGDERSDLDCYLFDEQGLSIDSDTDDTDTCRITVTPKWTGTFTLVIKNIGPRPDSYQGKVF